MAKRKGFTSTQKFTAALAIIRGEKSAVEVGREMSCHPTLVTDWRNDLITHGAIIFDKATEEGEKEKRIAILERTVGRLVTENSFLERVLGRNTGA
jgi:transposase-like protein